MFRIKEQETHEIIYQILGQNIKIRKSKIMNHVTKHVQYEKNTINHVIVLVVIIKREEPHRPFDKFFLSLNDNKIMNLFGN